MNFHLTPQERALCQLEKRVGFLWQNVEWIHEFKDILSSDEQAQGLIDYLEIFDAEFLFDQYLEEFMIRKTLEKCSREETWDSKFMELLLREVKLLIREKT